MTREEEGAKLLDELLVLFSLYREEFVLVKQALEYIATVKRNNPNHPITASLAEYMRRRGYL